MSLIAFCGSLSVYLTRVGIRAGPEVGPQEEDREVGTKELLLLIKTTRRLSISSLFPGFTEEFTQRL